MAFIAREDKFVRIFLFALIRILVLVIDLLDSRIEYFLVKVLYILTAKEIETFSYLI